MAFLHRFQDSPRSPASIGVHHEFRIAPRHDLHILVHSKGVVELASRLGLAVLDVADLTVDTNLHASFARLRRAEIGVRLTRYEMRVRVNYRCGQVQDAADGYRVLESRRIERNECGPAVSERCRGAEGELECLL